MANEYIFYQLFENQTSTYTYILGDSLTKEAVIIDPVFEMVGRDHQLLLDLELKLKFILDTHVHADHVTGASQLKKLTGARTVQGAQSEVKCVDIKLNDGDTLMFGNQSIMAIETPGHTDGCVSFLSNGMVFTGDALMVRSAGRTDFQNGSAAKLFHSIQSKLYQLPDSTLVFPGHDYNGQTKSTIGLEKKFNSRIPESQTLSGFSQIMNNLKLAHPKKIHQAVPANLNCGEVTNLQNGEKV